MTRSRSRLRPVHELDCRELMVDEVAPLTDCAIPGRELVVYLRPIVLARGRQPLLSIRENRFASPTRGKLLNMT